MTDPIRFALTTAPRSTRNKQTLSDVCIATVFLLLAGCVARSAASMETEAGATKAAFGTTRDGVSVELYTLRNSKGFEAKISNYGGILISLKVPDRAGKFDDVVLGYDTLDGYLTRSPYFGALIGRYGNRIGKARFTLDGHEFTLAANNGPNSLHGGRKGFDKVVWQVESYADNQDSNPTLKLHYVSKDGEEGFPGTLDVRAIYSVMNDNALKLEFTATTDKTTVVNLTHHSYFNLAGKGDVLAHEIMIPADRFTPVDEGLIPTGELRPVKGTPFDFNVPMTIGARITEQNEQLKFGKGYDHNWVFNKRIGDLTLLAKVTEPTTGRVMEVLSTEPGLQFYSGNTLNGAITGKGGRVYNPRTGFCLEPQHYPDSPNRPDFPSVVLKPGEVYRNTIVYRFSTN